MWESAAFLDSFSIALVSWLALEECNHEFFPNVHKLLRILCTLPITSAECERSYSTLRRLNVYEGDHDQWARIWTCATEHRLRWAYWHWCNNQHFCTEASTAPPSFWYSSWVNGKSLQQVYRIWWSMQYVKQLLYYSIFNLLRSISSGSEIYNPLLEMLAMFGAEIIGNLCSESRKRHFWRPEI